MPQSAASCRGRRRRPPGEANPRCPIGQNCDVGTACRCYAARGCVDCCRGILQSDQVPQGRALVSALSRSASIAGTAGLGPSSDRSFPGSNSEPRPRPRRALPSARQALPRSRHGATTPWSSIGGGASPLPEATVREARTSDRAGAPGIAPRRPGQPASSRSDPALSPQDARTARPPCADDAPGPSPGSRGPPLRGRTAEAHRGPPMGRPASSAGGALQWPPSLSPRRPVAR
jgi:hypothetical protein